MHALYAFARISDDLSDQNLESPKHQHPGRAQPAEDTSDNQSSDCRRQHLAAWRRLVVDRLPEISGSEDFDYLEIAEELLNDDTPQVDSKSRSESVADAASVHPKTNWHHESQAPLSLDAYAPLWPALRDAMLRYQIPRRLLIDIVDGVSMDVDVQRIADWPGLFDYCYHVASAVGLACVHIWTAGGPIPVRPAIRCGVAFQLTNILRDVAEDAGYNRIYIPISVLAEHGVEPSCWLAGTPDGDWQRAIDEVGKRARELYRNGWPTIESLSPDGQRMFSLIWRNYHSLLEEVLTHKSRLWNQPKLSLPTSRRWSLAASHFISPLYHRLPQPTAGNGPSENDV